MERCGHEFTHSWRLGARALIGWVKGGLGMSVIVVAYFFFRHLRIENGGRSPRWGSALMPPLNQKAGYDRRDSASLIARRHRDGHAGAAGNLHDRDRTGHQYRRQWRCSSPASFRPFVIMLCLMAVVYIRARARNDWPVDTRPSLKRLGPRGAARPPCRWWCRS